MNNQDRLRKLRDTLGLSQREAAQRIGVSESSISNFEANRYAQGCSSQAKDKINAFLDAYEDKNDVWICSPNKDASYTKKDAEFSFTKGRRYRICDSFSSLDDDYATLNPTTGAGCIFIYLRKEGKHHMFREERGGWNRTYTDKQLQGKHIREV